MKSLIMHGLQPSLLLCIFLIVAYFLNGRAIAAAQFALRDYLEQHRLEAIHCRHRGFFRGPFFWRLNVLVVFRVTVEDRNGFPRNGWACCGDHYLGIFGQEIELVCDDGPGDRSVAEEA
jgi:hypothetical protein